jgi:hypothetical protein
MRYQVFIACLLLCVGGGQANAADKAQPCQLVKVGSLPIKVAPGNRILVAGSIKGQPGWFQLDTGSSMTLFDGSVISRFGVVPGRIELRGSGIGGQFSAFRSNIPDIQLGTYHAGTLPMFVSDRHFLRDDVFALLGEDFFDYFDLDIDIGHNAFNAFEYNRCDTEPVYWAERFSEADIVVQNHRILISVAVNGRSARALLDTGAWATIVSAGLARRLGIDVDGLASQGGRKTSGVDKHPVDIYLYTFTSFGIGDEIIKNPRLRIADFGRQRFDFNSLNRFDDAPMSDFDIILGVDFMQNHHMYIETRGGKMFFTWNGGSVFLPPKPPADSAQRP